MKLSDDGEHLLVRYLHDDGELSIPDPLKHGINFQNQVFHFRSGDGKYHLHFDISKLKRIITRRVPAFDTWRTSLTLEDIRHVIANNGIERAHIARISLEVMRRPGILVDFPEGSQVVVDGNHRMVKRWVTGHTYMDFWLVPLEEAKPCLLDIPPGGGITDNA